MTREVADPARIAELEAEVFAPLTELDALAEVEAILEELEEKGGQLGAIVRTQYGQILASRRRCGFPDDPASIIDTIQRWYGGGGE